MVFYECIICLKMFNKKSNYLMHTEQKKTPCVGNIALCTKIAQKIIFDTKYAQNAQSTQNVKNELKEIEDYEIFEKKESTYKCKYCDKNLSRLSSLKRHYSVCKNKIENEKNEELKNKSEENERLKIENEKLKIENEKLNNINNINNRSIIINNNINNNININIVNYKEEDLSKLDLKKILTYDNSFIEMVFRDIHCNPIFPENQNILLPSLTRYDIYIKLNNEWLKRNKKEILTERYTTIRGHIMDLYDKEREINESKADKEYFHFLKQIKLVDPSNVIYKPNEEKKIIDGIANVLYNHKDNIKSIDKKPLILNKKI